MKELEKIYREAALKEFPINKKHFGSVAEAFPRIIFEKAFAEGFLKAREMALELEDHYAGQFQLRKYLEHIGESEVTEKSTND